MHKIFISLDWDYMFSVPTSVRDRFFPNENNWDKSVEDKEIIWNYLLSNALTRKVCNKHVKFRHEVFSSFTRMLNFIDFKAVDIVEEHDYLYYCVLNSMQDCDEVTILNLDFHHDYYLFDGKSVRPNNWLSALDSVFDVTDIKFNKVWIGSKYSEYRTLLGDVKDFGIQTEFTDELKEKILNSEDEVEFHLFICRSRLWSPPMYNYYFELLCSLVKNKNYPNTHIAEGVDKSTFLYDIDSSYDIQGSLKGNVALTLCSIISLENQTGVKK